MNILVVCHYGLYQDLSASFVHGQTCAYARQGHRVRVIIPIGFGKRGPDGKRFGPGILCRQADGTELYYVRHATLSKYGKRRFNRVAACMALAKGLTKILRGFSPDVIHAHTLGFDAELGAWLKARLKAPLVVTTHGSDASIPYEKGELAFLRSSCDRADAVVAVSSALAAKVQRCGTETPVRCILNGFKLDHVPAEQEKIPLTFIQVGHLLRQKRVHVTLEAFSRIHAAHPSARLEIVGAGPERTALEARCRGLCIEEQVTFTGQIPNRQVLEKMAAAQFFVMPSVREGFGIVYLEAMACGCITIGTQGEGIADLIVSGENGFLVPPDDPEAVVSAFQTCLKDPAYAGRVAEAGRKAALRLTWEENARNYEELFKELI